ncbi:MAG: PAS domain-containing protein [Thermoproteota archaeon]
MGRRVQQCHPQKSVHIVNRILDSFRSGKKDVAEFWIEMGGRKIHIRYYAVRDKDGKYLGTIEVTQDITDMKKIEGERRLLDWDG